MSYWYEVFDNEEVQFSTRTQVAKLGALGGAATAATVTGLALGHAALVPMWAALGVLVLVWLGVIRYSAHRFERLQRVVWCVKISDRHVVGYDYARHRTTLDWTEVERVALTREGLLLAGPDRRALEVPVLFPDFAALSHRIVHYAEFYSVPVFVDGQPWQAIDVYAHFPDLRAGVLPR